MKPARQGSSIGVSLVEDASALDAALEAARRYDSAVVIEHFVAGRELTVGVLDRTPLVPIEIEVSSRLLTYAQKYDEDFPARLSPAAMPLGTIREAQELALRAHRALGLKDVSRVDLRLDEAGRFRILEVNALPGLTPKSLLPASARQAGVSYDRLCEEICRLALRDSAGSRRKASALG